MFKAFLVDYINLRIFERHFIFIENMIITFKLHRSVAEAVDSRYSEWIVREDVRLSMCCHKLVL